MFKFQKYLQAFFVLILSLIYLAHFFVLNSYAFLKALKIFKANF